MIDLGLARIAQLVRLLQTPLPFPWRAIHVAGTNGKGSVCAYISSALTHSHLHVGRFNSPHLLDRWDSICINELPIAHATFLAAEAHVHALDRAHGVGASEFELLAATAFEVFTRERVQVAVIEVGMGGRGDATNVFPGVGGEEGEGSPPLVTVITKMGMDHEGFLGTTLREIAWHKAGILKRGVPCVVDGTNDPAALAVVEQYALAIGAGELRRASPPPADADADGRVRITTRELGTLRLRIPLHGGYQAQNTQVACEALSLASPFFPQITPASVAAGIEAARWPGRLDWVDLTPLVPALRGRKVLLDGAHNPQAARELGGYVDGIRGAEGVDWVVGATAGKDVTGILGLVLRRGDRVFAVPFGEVDGMPWVRAMEAGEVVRAAEGACGGVEGWECASAVEGLERAVEMGGGRQVVVAGSLYLVGSILRLLREKTVV